MIDRETLINKSSLNTTYSNNLLYEVWNTAFSENLTLTCLMIEKYIKSCVFIRIGSWIECTTQIS